MVNNVMLDNVSHKDLKIITRRGASYGDNIRAALAVPSEFRRLVADYPIMFRKNPETGGFETVVLCGFEENENLFLNNNGWDASYIPMSVERIPFAIGYSGQVERQPVIHVDMDHPRVNYSDGEAVFLEHGGNAPYLDKINSILSLLLQETALLKEFGDAMSSMELLEAFTLKARFEQNYIVEIKGFYTINEEKLNGLTVEQLYSLHQMGYLEHVYMIIASLSNIHTLIRRKQFLLNDQKVR